MSANELEQIIATHNTEKKTDPKDKIETLTSDIYSGKRLKANKSASMFDMIKMISKLIELTMPNVKFIPAEAKTITLDSMKDFNCPVITYKTISREPKVALKPMTREDFDYDGKIGTIASQKFKCYVQFDIFASNYQQAEETMEGFEELIFNHKGFIKKNGVAELLFQKQITDDSYVKLRETLSIRNLIYYVEIEKSIVIIKEKIKEIETKIQGGN